MTKYRTTDGAFFEASSPLELIEKLRADSRQETEDIEHFMIMVSDLANVQSAARVRIETPEAFVEDLLAAELVTIVEGD